MSTSPPRRPPARPAARSSRLPWILGAVVVVAIGLVAILASRGGEETGVASTEVADVAIEGAPLPRLSGGTGDPGVGAPVPTLVGVDSSGAPVRVGGAPAGVPKAIVVVAHWCPHCQAEVPRIVEWLDDGGLPDGVEVQAVSTAVDRARPNHPPSAWLEEEGWTVPTLVDDAEGSAAAALGVNAFPFFVFVDGDGRLVGRTSGEIEIDALERTMEQLAATG